MPAIEVPSDPSDLLAQALGDGWGDGLPIVPPTPDLVHRFVQASGLPGDHEIGRVPPALAMCTIAQLATNAAMAGAPPAAMPLMHAALDAMLDPSFDLAGINATTASVVPAVIVNGPVRDELGIPYQHCVFGGAASSAPAIGRALRLVVRNVGGQVAGETTESVFGQPGRVTGIVVAEWEERSPWAPLAERRGVTGDAVTVFGTLGTVNILETHGDSGIDLLQVIGRSLAYMGNNNFSPTSLFAEQVVAINPVWAKEIIGRDVPHLEDVQEIIWQSATVPAEYFGPAAIAGLEPRGRVRDGKVWLMDSPSEVHVIVCGGDGSLHATMLPGFSHSVAVSRPVRSV